LTYLASACLPDCFEELLAGSLREVVLEEENPLLRQTLIDLATNKSFRRDIFVKGHNKLTPAQTSLQLGKIRFLPLEGHPPTDKTSAKEGKPAYAFMTGFGQVIGDPAVYSPIAKMLESDQGCSMEDLQASEGESADELPIIISLFLDAGRITFDRAQLGRAATAVAQHANQSVLEIIQAGGSCSSVVLPRAGTSLEISLVEVLILQAHLQGLKGDMLASCVNLGLDALGAQLLDANHSPVRSMSESMKKIGQISSDFLDRRLPVMCRLGAFPQDWC
jgi:hypothetical protein